MNNISHETTVYTLFSTIAPRYKVITRLLSFGQDQYWKRELLALLAQKTSLQPTLCLDVACGTGDITYALARHYPQATIVGLDFNKDMLKHAQSQQLADIQNQNRIRFTCQDMADTYLSPESCDIITGGYALRNAPNLESTLQEIARILKPAGSAAFLEFSRPPNGLRWFFHYYALKMWGALWGLIMHGKPSVYTYIANSCQRYPSPKTFEKMCAKVGLKVVTRKSYLLGFTEIIIIAKCSNTAI